MKILVVLTQWKRNNLDRQLESIYNQTLKPDYIVVFQNESHIDITELKQKYSFVHIHNTNYNTKFFGRFAACFSFPVDICLVIDDDLVPGRQCIETFVTECLRLNGIMGGNGRIGTLNPNSNTLYHPPDCKFTSKPILVDFVGHIWCFKKEWLHYMFTNPPYTYDTGEDMHFCFSAKILGSIHSYVCKQANIHEAADITYNALATDEHSSYKTTSPTLRTDVERSFVEKYDFKFIANQ